MAYSYGPDRIRDDPVPLINEIEDLLQQKVNDGIITIDQFTTLSQRLEAIQDLYLGAGADAFENRDRLMSSLTQLRSEINYLSTRK